MARSRASLWTPWRRACATTLDASGGVAAGVGSVEVAGSRLGGGRPGGFVLDALEWTGAAAHDGWPSGPAARDCLVGVIMAQGHSASRSF